MSGKISDNSVVKVGQKRIDAIDVTKGIGMLFVIFAHVNYTEPILTLIYSFHMPLFFIISGMLFNREKFVNFGAFLKKRFKSLICPYIFFSLVITAYIFVMDFLKDGFAAMEWEKHKSHIVQIFLSQGPMEVVSAPLWFILCLFVIEIMYYFISKLKPYFIIPIAVIFACVGWYLNSPYCDFNSGILPWSFDAALFSFGFYAFGNLTGGKVKELICKIQEHKHKVLICISSCVILVAINTPIALLNGKVSIGMEQLSNGFLLYLTGIIGTAAVLVISILLENVRFLKYIGKNSLVVMSVHHILRVTLVQAYILLGFGQYNNSNFVETIIPLIIVYSVTFILTFIYTSVTERLFKKV